LLCLLVQLDLHLHQLLLQLLDLPLALLQQLLLSCSKCLEVQLLLHERCHLSIPVCKLLLEQLQLMRGIC
jgi:hypothetical protein